MSTPSKQAQELVSLLREAVRMRPSHQLMHRLSLYDAAQVVDAALSQARAEEREACARLLVECGTGTDDERIMLRAAEAIRARGAAPAQTEG